MTTIKQALMGKTHDIRVTCVYRWLVWDDDNGEWVIYEKKPYTKHTVVVIRTDNEAVAVAELINE